MQKSSTVLLFVTTVIMGCSRSNDVATPEIPGENSASRTEASEFYSVAKYDPTRSAEVDLLATINQAQTSNRRIILEIGGHW